MHTISMLELRTKSREVIQRLQRGERLALTFRGKKVATLLPEQDPDEIPVPPDDPFRSLCRLAEPELGSMTNEQIDRTLYGEPQDVR